MIDNTKKVIDSKDILQIFGIGSDLFEEISNLLNEQVISNKNIYLKKFKKWKSFFIYIYGRDLEKSLFLKHTYLTLMLKIILIIKLNIVQNLDLEDSFDDYINNDLKSLNISEYDYFFNLTNVNKKIFRKVFNILEGTTFSHQDLFSELYQQLFYAITRHKLGEFYTPPNLVKKMVEDILFEPVHIYLLW